ncbi:MAG: formate C-acetyltransferase/glycerol dehydratase family glycyl radical enzyme [Candidatus Lokiarchaeota archaeon]|nr:formate C-acetyltransferase/glycerol dehydratase family glycyl radical enzyme [Candidatus Lokiarchaeota archaeon]
MQLEQNSISNYKERTLRMKNELINSPHEICIERAKLFTESYKKTKSEDPIIRFAKAMDHYLTNMTLKIWQDEFIVGNRCTKYVGTPLFPEARIDTIEQDIDSYSTRPVQKLFLTDPERQFIKEKLIAYWKNEEITVQERFQSYLSQDIKNIMEKLVFAVDVELSSGIGHFFPGHENLLKTGINGLIQKTERSLKRHFKDRNKKTFLESVIILLKAASKFIQRFSSIAKKMAEKERNPARRKELYDICKNCHNISEKPPENFEEAIQLIYFTHLICGLEDGGFAISIGRLDQYLYPYYLADLKEGKVTRDKAQFLIECFFIKLSTLWNYVISKGVIAVEGPPIAENVVIGGLDREGKDALNELSLVILDAYTHIKSVQPTFCVRIHKDTSEDFLIKVGESIKSGTSIALLNDQVMIPGLINQGFSREDAREYAPVGCVEPQHPYKSFGSTNANQFNIVKCLELALNNGIDMLSRKEYGIKSGKKITFYEDLWENFKDQVKFFIDYMVKTMFFLDKSIAELTPQPFLSATIDDCIDRGLDITNGGAIYNFTGPQLVGLATVSDSLAVIKKVVFEDKILSFKEIVQMLTKNYRGVYQGKKGTEWRELFINKIPKFGNDNDYVDQIAVDVAKLYCEEISKHSNYRGGKFNPGIYSTTFHLAFGVFTGASADGRRKTEPLSNGLCPTSNMDEKGPTAILNSVKKLKNELMTNGNSLILSFHPNTLKLDLLIPLIRTYFEPEGGYQVQFNVVGKETLYEAQKNPENYRGLVVRIAGYSVYFTELSKIAQDEIMDRTEY